MIQKGEVVSDLRAPSGVNCRDSIEVLLIGGVLSEAGATNDDWQLGPYA